MLPNNLNGNALRVSPLHSAERDLQIDHAVRDVIERLAALHRTSGSEGERTAARIIAEQLQAHGAAVRLETERVHGTYWVPIGLACAVAAVSSRRGGPAGVIAGALGALSVSDDLEIGRRPLRRLLHQRTSTNVIGEFRPDDAAHTLVVHAHHDAAHTGLVFHPGIAKLASCLAGDVIERAGGTPPAMWGAALGPLCVAVGSALAMRLVRGFGGLLSAGYAAAMADIARSPAVPGANDNLSGVAVLIALAHRLAARPPRRLRVLLLSTGSEESFLESMERFGQRHFQHLPQASTTFLCVESVGSPELMLLSGEGLLRLHRYPEDQNRLLTNLADRSGISLRDPFHYRFATDGQVPLRAGYPTSVISSIDWYKAPSNYHWRSDRPENLDYRTVARAATLAAALVRHLDG